MFVCPGSQTVLPPRSISITSSSGSITDDLARMEAILHGAEASGNKSKSYQRISQRGTNQPLERSTPARDVASPSMDRYGRGQRTQRKSWVRSKRQDSVITGRCISRTVSRTVQRGARRVESRAWCRMIDAEERQQKGFCKQCFRAQASWDTEEMSKDRRSTSPKKSTVALKELRG